jgi:small subunit ribosomal protein S8
MSMNDPIADILTRIRNGLHAGHERVTVPASRIKEDLCRVLKEEGYIRDYAMVEDDKQGVLHVELKYRKNGSPVIQELKRVSKPSLRVYIKSEEIRQVRSGLGISIVTTSRGLMTSKQARREHVGGEVLCEVW